jgi:hypothetical protein
MRPPMRSPSNRRYLRPAAVALIALAGAGCLSGENLDLGHDLDASTRSNPSAATEAGSSQVQDQSLTAQISIDPSTTGTICAGTCVQLQVIAMGGGGSYSYKWEDDAGAGAGPEQVCPATTTTYSVFVTAAASDIGANATFTITVVPCDGGAPGSADSGATVPSALDAETAPTPLCIQNPSFEGATVTGPVGPPGTPPTTTPPDWQACMGTPTVDPTLSTQPVQNGKSYVGLPVGAGTLSGFTSSLGTTLCSPLEPGVEYSFCVDVAVAFPSATVPQGFPAPMLQLWGGPGGTSACDASELLWTSPPITNTTSSTKDCGTFFLMTSEPVSNIVLEPTVSAVVGTGVWSYVIIDNIVP